MLVLDPSLFDNVPSRDRGVALDLLKSASYDYGDRIVEDGDTRGALFYVVEGSIAMMLDDYELGVVMPDQIVGALELFSDPLWLYSLKAVEPTEVLIFDRPAYDRLRRTDNRVAYNLERLTLKNLTQRLRATDDRIGAFTDGDPNPEDLPQPGMLEWLTTMIRRRDDVPQSRLDPVITLSESPLFVDADPEIAVQLASEIRSQAIAEGAILFEAGDEPKGLYFLAEGKVEVRIPTGRDRSDVAAVLEPGTMFGAGALLAGAKHGATCRASEPTVLYFISAARWEEWFDANDATGSAVRRAVIRALAEQTTTAYAHVYHLHLDHLSFVRESVSGLYGARRVL